MKKLFLFILVLTGSLISYGNHLKGGWVYYEALGPGSAPGTTSYRIVVKQYLDCNSTTMQIDREVFLGIFNNTNNSLDTQITITLTETERLQRSEFDPCISPQPFVCYRIDNYITTVDLRTNAAGYTLAVQRCCRVRGIVNVGNSDQVGVSYTTSIPGTINGINYQINNSPLFAQKDDVVVCFNGYFTFDFGATDRDNDVLVYEFCDGLVGGSSGNNGARPNPPSNPPYSSVPYIGGYVGSSPMGPGVTINPQTGEISGIAPETTGDYVVAVCASEFRNGVKIGETKKEIHITVANCTLAAAQLIDYINCDSLNTKFSNLSTASNITSYTWEFGDPASGANNTSTDPTPSHRFSDTGVYNVVLKVENTQGCSDDATAEVRIYPGFNPDFSVTGSCFLNPFNFTDNTTTAYGVVNKWVWNFGDDTTTADTSTTKNSTYKYATQGSRTAQLTVSNSKGCVATVNKVVEVKDIPLLILPFTDTLICSIDSLPLIAEGTGIFSWSPTTNMTRSNTNNPLVFPRDTITYLVTLNDNGCVATDSIKVNVLDFITVDLGQDTAICQTDTFTLAPTSDALRYTWTPATGLNNINIKNPVARPLATTSYVVNANLGKCADSDTINIKVTPYPQADAGQNVTICYGERFQLQGTVTASAFTWSPTTSLLNGNTLTPVAGPTATTSYILTSTDTLGCPKPFRDTVVVTVIPHVVAFAGNDTAVVAGQPVRLTATGGTSYSWSPLVGIDSANTANPVVRLSTNVDSVTYTVRVSVLEGCYDEDDITVKVFKTGPEIFVPSAFTPNNDFVNDVIRPYPVGIKQLNFFRIYNRWGQLLYSTSQAGQGWDGTFGGQKQASGTFVYMTEAIDYLDRKVVKKGTIVLIR